MIDNSRASADFDVQWFRQEPYYLSGEGPGARETLTHAHKALFISVKDYKEGRRKTVKRLWSQELENVSDT